ncbi:hypothetical protein Pcinc_006653 [Petrolisthes cinctipes]|uniref:Uncharacterized protein n=1 Tax=Petrolisthes cinctipes TaxID=88211 RepID=A0AAE1GCL4_PETCI|nr:hypothetical protein Pcinc_006653 [Petrolisthes cinctipes]
MSVAARQCSVLTSLEPGKLTDAELKCRKTGSCHSVFTVDCLTLIHHCHTLTLHSVFRWQFLDLLCIIISGHCK